MMICGIGLPSGEPKNQGITINMNFCATRAGSHRADAAGMHQAEASPLEVRVVALSGDKQLFGMSTAAIDDWDADLGCNPFHFSFDIAGTSSWGQSDNGKTV